VQSVPTLKSSYVPKDCLRLQSLFQASGHMQHLLKVIFENVVIFWSFAFSEVERASLIHSWIFYCPAINTLHALAETLNKLHSKSSSEESSKSSISSDFMSHLPSIDNSTRIEHANQLASMILLFLGLIPSKHEPGMRRILGEISRLPSVTQLPHIWNQMMSIVCAMPDKVFNIMRRQADPRFQHEVYFTEITKQFGKCLENLTITIGFPFFSLWLAKMDSIGRLDMAINAFDPLTVQQSSPDASKIIAKVFSTMPPTSVERLLLSILQNPKVLQYPKLESFLASTISELFESSSTARFVLTEKIFASCSLPWWILRQLLDFLRELALSSQIHDFWMDMLDKMATTAGNTKFIKTESYQHQRRLNRALIYVFEKSYVTKDEVEMSQLLMSLMAAVQELLNQPSQKLAFLGMRLGEAFSTLLDPANPLKFDGARDEEDDEPDVAPITEDPTMQEEKEMSTDFGSSGSEYLDPTEDYFQYIEKVYRLDNGVSAGFSAHGNGRFRKGKFVQLDLNDDLSDVSDVKTPLYLRECLTSLRSEEPKILEVAMRVVGPLIASRPDDLPELAVTVSSTLLHVMNNYELEDFDRQKMDAMVALVAYAPNKVIPFLTKELYAANYSSHERFVMLDALCEGAQQLSEHKIDPRPEFNPVALKALNFERHPQMSKGNIDIVASSPKIQEVPKSGTSRRWATERKEIQTFHNRLAPHMDQLLQLLHFKDHQKGWLMLMNDPRLLGKLIYSISVFVDCTGVSNPEFEKTCREIVEIAWKVRYHEDPFVRRAVVLTVGSMIRNAPAWVLFEKIADEMNELVAWLDQNGKDSDEEVRMLSTVALMQLSKIYKSNPQYRPFDVSD
jgi:hypothetical protein